MALAEHIKQWMIESSPTFEFAASLHNQFKRTGSLSERQIAAAEKCIAARKAAQDRAANAPAAQIARIEQGFAAALASGLKRPALTIGTLRFTPAKAESANPGAIYAKERETGAYLGKFAAGRFVRSRDCTDEQQAQLVSIAADPLAAAVNHGKLTGACAMCSRPLSDPESVERGVGPICAGRWGW